MGFFDQFKKFKRGEEKKEKMVKVEKPKVKEVKAKKEAVLEPEIKKPTPPKTEEKGVKKEETGDAYRILIKPLITEKATNLSSENKYVFEVRGKANKLEIKKAIKNVYGVEPINVNIVNVSGKSVRFGRTSGRTKDRKKAIVTLKEGDKIEVYEGV
jgi:large subunit ribosomal protein L23